VRNLSQATTTLTPTACGNDAPGGSAAACADAEPRGSAPPPSAPMPLGPLTPCRAPLRRRSKGTPGERTAFSFTIPSALDAT
jgi:hypothetical protein